MPIFTEDKARNVFGDPTVEAMHELALLIFAARTLADAGSDFDKLDLVAKIARQHALKIQRSIDRASTELLQAMRRKPRDDAEVSILAARKANASALTEAAVLAEILARLRRKAYENDPSLTDDTDLMFKHLQVPLEHLGRTWSAA